MFFSILYHSLSDAGLFVRGFFKIIVASLLFAFLSGEALAIGEISSPLNQTPKNPQRSTVGEDLNRELEEALEKIKQFQPGAKLDIPKEVNPSEASGRPPERFLNLRMGVMREEVNAFVPLTMTVKEFIARQPHDSVTYEQLAKDDWIIRFYYTDRLKRQNHEISVLITERSDPFKTEKRAANIALLSRVVENGIEAYGLSKYEYIIALELAKPVPYQRSVPAEAPDIPHVPPIPDTTLKISGREAANVYWAKVQSTISSRWEPPPIDMVGQSYTMIVKFRLLRDGTIKEVAVKQSSGNVYFDMAGQRAVHLRGLPVFPAEMTDRYKDVEMVFSTRGK